MASLSVNGICRLTRDAEVTKSASGCWFNVGIVAYRKDPLPGKQTSDFFDADLWMKHPCDGYEKSLTKGRLIYISDATLRNVKYTKDGIEKSFIKIQVMGHDLLGDNLVKEPEAKVAPITCKHGLVTCNVCSGSKKVEVTKKYHHSELPPPEKPFRPTYNKPKVKVEITKEEALPLIVEDIPDSSISNPDEPDWITER